MRLKNGLSGTLARRSMVFVMAIVLALLPILGNYTPAQAAIVSLNGVAPPVTVVAGANVTVRISPDRSRVRYSFDNFATQSECVDPGGGYFDVVTPSTVGTHTLYVRYYSSITNCNNNNPGYPDDTLANSINTVLTPNAVMPVAANPDLVPECGIDIILVLDESGSIQLGNLTDEVRTSAIEFVTGLSGTGTYVAVAEFDTGARRAQIDSTGNGGGGGASYTIAFQNIDADYVTDFSAYMNNTADPGVDARGYYIGSIGSDDYTNWEGGFQQVLAIGPRAGSGRQPLVIHFTDGDPTAVGANPGTVVGTSRVGESLAQSFDESNAIKDSTGGDGMTSHIFTVGYPNPRLNEGNVKTVAGPQSWPAEPNLGRADYIVKSPDDNLGDIFRGFVTQLCGVTVAVEKYVDDTNTADPADVGVDPNWVATQGWEIEGTATLDVAGAPVPQATDYSWEFPVQTGSGTVSADTNATGRVNFSLQYIAVNGSGAIDFVGTENPTLAQDDLYYLPRHQLPGGAHRHHTRLRSRRKDIYAQQFAEIDSCRMRLLQRAQTVDRNRRGLRRRQSEFQHCSCHRRYDERRYTGPGDACLGVSIVYGNVALGGLAERSLPVLPPSIYTHYELPKFKRRMPVDYDARTRTRHLRTGQWRRNANCVAARRNLRSDHYDQPGPAF